VICGDKNAQDRSVSDFSTMKKSPRRAGLAELIAKRGKIDDYFAKKRPAFPSRFFPSLLESRAFECGESSHLAIPQFSRSAIISPSATIAI